MSEYTIIIGLEVHVQLQTNSKLFCGCETTFGAKSNTQTCPVCIGLPGSLPVMNRRAFELSLRTAVAINCEIAPYTKWDRKNYYYPDLPKGYQISQFDLPFSHDGWLEISDPKGAFETKRIRIIRAHLEEDAGKSIHDEVASKGDSRIDLNRTGTPLLEIVSHPDLRSAAEVKAYLTELKLLLTYIGVSDCNMQEGSLRVDANINLHIDTPDGNVATPIVEIKNMNSFRAVERALEFEADRQWDAWNESHIVMGTKGGHKTTRGWDDQRQLTYPQRQKEESSDYRYFPDPDLVPVTTTVEEIAQVRADLGELPAAIRTRLQAEMGLTAYDAEVIVNQGHSFVGYFFALAARGGDGKQAANWLTQDVQRVLNEQNISIEQFSVAAMSLGELLQKIKSGELDNSRAREVFAEMVTSGKTVVQIMSERGIEQVDESELIALCSELIAANPKIVADVKAGKGNAIGGLVGQVKKRNPNVNPGRVKDICSELIAQL